MIGSDDETWCLALCLGTQKETHHCYRVNYGKLESGTTLFPFNPSCFKTRRGNDYKRGEAAVDKVEYVDCWGLRNPRVRNQDQPEHLEIAHINVHLIHNKQSDSQCVRVL